MGALSLQCGDARNISVRVATSPSEYLQAIRLKHQAYIRAGILELRRLSRDDVLPQLFLPGSALIVATQQDAVIGTISVYEDSELGLPMEEVHPEELKSMRKRGPRISEVGALAVAETSRGRGVTLMLYYAMYRWAVAQRLDGIVACVHPSHS